jgi:hypothetical protein
VLKHYLFVSVEVEQGGVLLEQVDRELQLVERSIIMEEEETLQGLLDSPKVEVEVVVLLL